MVKAVHLAFFCLALAAVYVRCQDELLGMGGTTLVAGKSKKTNEKDGKPRNVFWQKIVKVFKKDKKNDKPKVAPSPTSVIGNNTAPASQLTNGTTLTAAQPAAPFISFIIPTKGRDTLPETIQSLAAQTDSDWEAVVVFDAVPVNIPANQLDGRVRIVEKTQKTGNGKNGAGAVRNVGFDHAKGQWVGFVDDDDTLDKDYVMWLKQESAQSKAPCIIFRMQFLADGQVLPEPGATKIEKAHVGISFSIKREEILTQGGVRFQNGEFEDWDFLQVIEAKYSYTISEHVAYFVRPGQPKTTPWPDAPVKDITNSGDWSNKDGGNTLVSSWKTTIMLADNVKPQ